MTFILVRRDIYPSQTNSISKILGQRSLELKESLWYLQNEPPAWSEPRGHPCSSHAGCGGWSPAQNLWRVTELQVWFISHLWRVTELQAWFTSHLTRSNSHHRTSLHNVTHHRQLMTPPQVGCRCPLTLLPSTVFSIMVTSSLQCCLMWPSKLLNVV